MAYHTPIYLFLFLPLAILCYAICPKKHRWKVLLLFSYLFFYSVSRKLLVYLLGATVLTHYIGIWLETLQTECKGRIKSLERGEKKEVKAQYIRKERGVLFCGIAAMIGVLWYLKYFNFSAAVVDQFCQQHGIGFYIQPRAILVPLGVSFYTLQSLGYMIDVYRGTIPAEKNIGKLGLFLGFFPQIMEGPICRYGETAAALYAGEQINRENLLFGIQRIIWGMFKKIVIADRLNTLVAAVYGVSEDFGGIVVIAAAVSYTIQLYMEFSGAIDIVIGSAQIFGVQMPENFRQPFFSRNASEFWRRWHISLGAWFRDYIFYPVSMSKIMKKWNKFGRAHVGEYVTKIVLTVVALFPVWFCNGLWHGANWTYLFYGMYYFVIISLENVLEPPVEFWLRKWNIKKENRFYHGLQIAKTWIIIFTGEMFFRSASVAQGKAMFISIFTKFDPAQLWDGTLLSLGLDIWDFAVVIAETIVVIVADILKEKGVNLRLRISELRLPVRWMIYYAAIFAVIIFGAYGAGYQVVDLIYAGF